MLTTVSIRELMRKFPLEILYLKLPREVARWRDRTSGHILSDLTELYLSIFKITDFVQWVDFTWPEWSFIPTLLNCLSGFIQIYVSISPERAVHKYSHCKCRHYKIKVCSLGLGLAACNLRSRILTLAAPVLFSPFMRAVQINNVNPIRKKHTA